MEIPEFQKAKNKVLSFFYPYFSGFWLRYFSDFSNVHIRNLLNLKNWKSRNLIFGKEEDAGIVTKGITDKRYSYSYFNTKNFKNKNPRKLLNRRVKDPHRELNKL